MKKLLIYIPSYNRYELLVRQLTIVSQSIDDFQIRNINVFVSDNASPDEKYLNLAKYFPQKYISVVRNQVNVGAVANVIRAFEHNEVDYIWILSDDDEIVPETLAVISKEVSQGQHDFFYLKNNIKGDTLVADGEIIQTQHEYLSKFSSLSMMGLISANIYPTRLNRFIEYIYLYGYTHFPHVAGTLKLMGREQFSLKCIGGNLIEWRANSNSYSHLYDMALTNVLFLAELIEDKHNRNLFINKHISDFGKSHFFPYAIKSLYNLKKAWTQVGFRRLFIVGASYVGWYVGRQMLRLAKFSLLKVHAWYRNF